MKGDDSARVGRDCGRVSAGGTSIVEEGGPGAEGKASPVWMAAPA